MLNKIQDMDVFIKTILVGALDSDNYEICYRNSGGEVSVTTKNIDYLHYRYMNLGDSFSYNSGANKKPDVSLSLFREYRQAWNNTFNDLVRNNYLVKIDERNFPKSDAFSAVYKLTDIGVLSVKELAEDPLSVFVMDKARVKNTKAKKFMDWVWGIFGVVRSEVSSVWGKFFGVKKVEEKVVDEKKAFDEKKKAFDEKKKAFDDRAKEILNSIELKSVLNSSVKRNSAVKEYVVVKDIFNPNFSYFKNVFNRQLSDMFSVVFTSGREGGYRFRSHIVEGDIKIEVRYYKSHDTAFVSGEPDDIFKISAFSGLEDYCFLVGEKYQDCGIEKYKEELDLIFDEYVKDGIFDKIGNSYALTYTALVKILNLGNYPNDVNVLFDGK